MPRLRHFPLLLLSCVLIACADKPEKKPPKKETTNSPRLVGRIASIPADRKFVLIQAYGKWLVQTGAILTTQGTGERTANLRATGEKLGQYAAADIQSGTLEIGDGVYTVATIPKQQLTPEITDADSEGEPESEVESPPKELE